MTLWQQRTYALAGMWQAAVCIEQLAQHGQITPLSTAEPLYHAVLTLDAPSVIDIFEQTNHQAIHQTTPPTENPLMVGLQTFIVQFAEKDKVSRDVLELFINILRLENVLNKNNQALAALGQGLNQVIRQKNEFQFEQHRILANLAGLYSDVVSPLSKPIRVKGKPELLTQISIQHQVRALLLAGIRCAVLWRQLGGKKRHFIFNRGAMIQAARSLL